MNKNKVVLGMSGGVDSSVAAFLLQRQGFEVIGVFMKNFSDSKNSVTGECLWKDELKMAKRISVKLGIKLFVVDYEKEYKGKVIDKMFLDYSQGFTPNPDTLCNSIIKFPALLKFADERGVYYIATGHYAKIVRKKDKFFLYMGKDNKKDQSYFIYDLKQKDLGRIIFPIGELTKENVRDIARRKGFLNWDKQGTRGICFVGNVDMKEFLKKNIAGKAGEVISSDGKIIGKHAGSSFYTIGERIGEGKGFEMNEQFRKIFKGRKFYVAQKLRGNRLIVVPKGDELLKRKNIFIKSLKLIDRNEHVEGVRFRTRIRHLGKLYPGKLFRKNKKWFFKFDKGVESIAQGQDVVLYKGERVVGGGEIRFL